MGIELEELELRNADDLPVRVDLRHDPERPVRGKVVVCHGFKGFRRWGFFPWVGEQLAAAGWMNAVLDFSMNGVGSDPMQFSRLDLFERNSYSQELEDLDLVIADLLARGPSDASLGLLGHSRAAVDVLVRAAEDAAVRALVTWNGVGDTLRFTARQLAQWEEDGRLEFTNARTGQKMAMSFDFVRDARDNAARFDLQRAARGMAAAHLIVHATDDMAVPVAESVILQAGREDADRCQRVEIASTTHTFGAVHPFAGSTAPLEQAMQLSLDWLDNHLREEAGGE
ncbi:hypothetical protein DRQ53_04530 [bacterium]|nr:MAG: hypothetical protein DRQ53_04530 [bacterium]